MKRWEKHLPSVSVFRTFFPLCKFCLRKCTRPNSYLYIKKINSGPNQTNSGIKHIFPETTIHKTSETNSRFQVNWRTAGKV